MPLWKRAWIVPCSAVAIATVCSGASMASAHQMPLLDTPDLSHTNRRAFFRARQDWELRQQDRRRAILRTQARCIRRARWSRELARCQHAFEHALQDLRLERRQAMQATIRRLQRNERRYDWRQSRREAGDEQRRRELDRRWN